MYDTIDVNNNKKFYNFTKLSKLVSYKNLLYNSIIIYYVIIKKLSDTNNINNELNKLPNINKITNNISIYNNYENNYMKLYNEILDKFKHSRSR